MGESVTKALSIGVGVFVTTLIASGIIYLFSQMQEIYRQVDTTNTNVSSKFGKYAMYDTTELTGMDLINCANKYYNDTWVVVSFLGRTVNNEAGVEYLNTLLENGTIKYEYKYKSVIQEVDIDGLLKTQITFTLI